MSMKKDLTEDQWKAIEKIVSTIQEKKDPRGRPPQDLRPVVNGILWICRTGTSWSDLPKSYPPYQTCHRYFQKLCKAGIWEKVLWELALDLRRRGGIDITECFIDGTFASAKKGGYILDLLRREKEPRSWRSQTLLAFLSPYGPSEQAPTK
jgi:transposase